MVSAVAFALLALGAASGGDPLPELDTLLSQANSKARTFAEQAMALQQRFASQQGESRAALARQKAEYEQRLDAYGNQSEAISAKNGQLRAFNSNLTRANEEMLADLMKLRGDNAELRGTLKSITNKVSVARAFLEESLKVTDDTGARELGVLDSTTRRPTLETFLAATAGEEVSLLAIAAARGDAPEDVVSALSSSLTDIANADAEGAAELKARFVARLEEAQKRQAWLNATQAELLGTRAQLNEQQVKLLEARAYLRATSRQLRDRLEGLRVFADTIDGSAASSLGRSGALNTTANATLAQAGEAVTAKAVGNARAVAVATGTAAPKAPLKATARSTSLRPQKKPASAAAKVTMIGKQGELKNGAPARWEQWLAKLR